MPRTPLFTLFRDSLRAADLLEQRHVSLDEAVTADWSRRRFLRTTAAATAGAAVASLPLRGRAQDAARVVILGGGTAGLTCAYRLQQNGVGSMILEAAPRVGGRMYSLQNYFPDNQVAELGGELIDTTHHAIRNLARELEVELLDLTYLDGSNGHNVFVDGKLSKSDADWIEAMRPLAKAIRGAVGENGENCDVSFNSGTEEGKRLDAMSIEEWLHGVDFDPRLRKLIEAAYVGEFGLELGEQSALNLLCLMETAPGTFGLFGESNERFRAKEGNGTIPIRLAQRLDRPVDLGSAVEAIRKRGDGYELTVRRGASVSTIRADFVVTTIPLTVMRAAVNLDGLDLPRLQLDTIRNLGYGTNSKMMIGVDARPWVQMNCTAYTFTDLPFQACWETSRGQRGTHGILTNFTGGRYGANLGNGTLQNRATEFAAMADKVFPGVAKAYTGKAVRQIWPAYEWTRGSYACYRPGQYQRYFGALAEPVGKLLFAGEHTMEENGFMNAAVESGERAASQLLGMLGLQQVRAA
ncbi:MAG TPA: FAD-dependent oxidoreductase [Thermoanaerobaculia bacterium]|jgi:monoamine oxidase